jgi:hypothetical protein
MVEFALRWVPFGNPPEDDLFIRFGMSRATFYSRLRSIVAIHLRSSVSSQDRLLVERAAEVLGPSVYDCEGECGQHCSCPPADVAPDARRWRDVHGVWRWI